MTAFAALLKRLQLVFAAVAAALMAPAAAQQANPAHYGALPNVSDVKISPDGTFAALLETADDLSAVMFYNLEQPRAAPVSVDIGDANPRSIVWANNDVILLLASESKTVRTGQRPEAIEFFRWLAVSRSRQETITIFDNEPGFYLSEAGVFYTVRNTDPNKGVFGRYTITERSGRVNLRRGFAYSLFEIDLTTGAQTLIELGNANTVNWITDAGGDPVLRIDYNQDTEKKRVYKKDLAGGASELLAEFDQQRGEPAPVVFFGLSDDNAAQEETNAIISVIGNHNRREIRKFSLDTGAIGEVVFSHPVYDVDGAVYDPQTASVTGASYIAHMTEVHYIDEDDRRLKSALAEALPGAAPLITSRSQNRTRLIVEANYADRPKRFFLYDANTNRLTSLAESYRALAGKVVAKKEAYDYAASDGLRISGYLTAPVGVNKENMPLIVLPHGGPWTRDDQAFDWWPFFYAARGYLVYQPNFRGSSGYGVAFLDAGNGEWGRRMQDDITEGVQKLIAEGTVDPERVCIVGSSYGGYAALAGATLTPALYQCAVSVNGVSNILQLLWHRADGEGENQFWKTRVGSRFRDQDALRQVSPMYAVTAQTPPIMLIHAEHDVIVPTRQSRRMRNALEASRIPHEYIILEGEDHWLSTSKMRTEMLRLSIDFIDRHIGD